MNERQLELALKKQQLQLKASAQRLHLAQELEIFTPILSSVDTVQNVGGWISSFLTKRPYIVAAAGALLVITKPRTVFRLARRGLFAWQMWRRGQAALKAFVTG